MGVLKRLFRSLWGVTYPGVDLTPAIDCEACRIARTAGKDACNVHRTHHDPHHPSGGETSRFDPY